MKFNKSAQDMIYHGGTGVRPIHTFFVIEEGIVLVNILNLLLFTVLFWINVSFYVTRALILPLLHTSF